MHRHRAYTADTQATLPEHRVTLNHAQLQLVTESLNSRPNVAAAADPVGPTEESFPCLFSFLTLVAKRAGLSPERGESERMRERERESE